jgi:hypothetical protein
MLSPCLRLIWSIQSTVKNQLDARHHISWSLSNVGWWSLEEQPLKSMSEEYINPYLQQNINSFEFHCRPHFFQYFSNALDSSVIISGCHREEVKKSYYELLCNPPHYSKNGFRSKIPQTLWTELHLLR